MLFQVFFQFLLVLFLIAQFSFFVIWQNVFDNLHSVFSGWFDLPIQVLVFLFCLLVLSFFWFDFSTFFNFSFLNSLINVCTLLASQSALQPSLLVLILMNLQPSFFFQCISLFLLKKKISVSMTFFINFHGYQIFNKININSK